MTAVLAVAVFVGAYVLIATEKVDRVKVALGGAALMLAFGILDSEEAFSSKETGIDWDVIFLLLGMMVIVGVLRQTGVFDYVAIWAAKKAKGEPFRVMTLLVLITAVASAMLDNVTTVLLVAPVTILICERLKAPPVPFLLAEVFASNIGGTATLIGDPPNIIIASQSGLSYMDFLSNLAPLVVVLMAAFVLLCRVMFRGAFTYRPEQVEQVMALDEKEAITDRPLLVRSLAVLALVTVLFAFHSVLHYEVSVIALLGAGLLVLIARRDPKPFLDEVEWPTLIFFGGLFIMVGALVHVGVVGDLAEFATDATDGRVGVASGVLLGGSAVLSALVDNIPYVATMAPLVDSLVQRLPAGTDGDVLWWSLALGADLGGNATAIGASANVVVLGIAARSGYPIGFWEFTKYGLIVTAVTIGLSVPYLWLRYFVLA
ncbi:MAG: ArsB/NhaD family transporter [Frankiaceae bacterium]|nr:ArsB/NhaD family transporter [Frankiaceae bacterium]